MADIFLSSDHHFWHSKIIEYGPRPFANVEEMTEVMIDRHNAIVRPQDHWYCLGDICILRGGAANQGIFTRTIKRMNGHKRIILGNHDHFKPRTYLEAGFEKILGTGRWLDDRVKGLLLSHYPVHPSSIGNAKANVHGHIHGNPVNPPVDVEWVKNGRKHKGRKLYINVSVEAINYTPVNLDELKQRIA